jgi:hypothetical protein
MALACRVSARTCLRVALHSRYQLSGGAPSKLGLAGFSRAQQLEALVGAPSVTELLLRDLSARDGGSPFPVPEQPTFRRRGVSAVP